MTTGRTNSHRYAFEGASFPSHFLRATVTDLLMKQMHSTGKNVSNIACLYLEHKNLEAKRRNTRET